MRAFVLSGGGTLGAWQVGQLLALFQAGVEPDLLVGTSVGAINAAAIAGDPSASGAGRLARIWRATRREHVLEGWGWRLPWAFSRRSLFSNRGLRALIERGLRYRLVEDAAVPLRIVTTSLETGEERVLSSGPVVEAVLASCSIPGIYPPVVWDGERLADGGLVDMVPVRPAILAGADEVYVLAASSRCPPARPVRHLHDVLLFSAGLLLLPSTDLLASCYDRTARVIVLPASCPFAVGPFDFSRTEALIEEGHSQAAEFLRAEVSAA